MRLFEKRLLLAFALCASALVSAAQVTEPRFEVRFPASVHSGPITGRVFVIVTRDGSREPRDQVGARYMGAPFFGVDIEQLQPGAPAVIDGSTLGYPPRSLRDIPPGDYYVQAFLNIYTQFHRSDGHTIWVHMDQWEGQQTFASPGNLYSRVQKVHLDSSRYTVKLGLTEVIPPVEVPPDTQWVKHIKIQSKLLTAFWGHPMYLGAVVLLPKGYDQHPDTYYPVDYEQDHFSLAPPYHFRETPPDASVGSILAMRQGEGYQLFKDWTSDKFPRMLMVTFLHPTPYYDDSYAVNSANNGPYGDAIMTELIPYVESHFRIIREPYARVLSGGSTGGWESLALQVQHPKFFGGAWVYYPDPIDFRQWQLSNIYDDENMFYAPPATATQIGSTDWQKLHRPWLRLPTGQIVVDQKQESQLEEVLGMKGRSAEQCDAWNAVYGPVGADGYPVPLWNKETGVIDHSVAAYMGDHGYDLDAYMQRNWARIGPSLVGKLHFYVGDADNFYLNLAVYLTNDFLSQTKNPYYAGSFSYGRPLKGHGIRPTTTGEMLRHMAEEIRRHAPANQPAASWNY
ncbi:MAG: alpha/beta hydrolase-fold protein [Terriglobia bacterium]|nr:alpha/beta hydrolase-fold protein [Terriglobia bacterium]